MAMTAETATTAIRTSDSYNPAQRAVVELLGRTRPPAGFAQRVGPKLKAQMEELLSPVTDVLDVEHPIRVTKHRLTTVHGCEQHHVTTGGSFEWTVPTVKGTVAHRAIELGVGWVGRATPVELVDEAIGRLVGDGLAPAQRFLTGLAPADLADLRSAATDLVTKFLECFPPLRRAWTPVTESRVVVRLFDGAVLLIGKTDLTLGRLEGDEPRKVIIDFKSGRPALSHREDLRFYALLEACRMGVPPRKVASYYLDSAEAHAEDVTEAVLQSAVRRTVDGIVRIVELGRRGRPPERRPGWVCRWCPALEGCADGQAELARQEEDGDAGW
jgi:hypothetical protein